MKKFLIVLVLLGAAWSAPQTRGRMAAWSEPVLVRLGPLGDRMLQPMHRTAARNELDQLLRQLQGVRQEGRRLPTERDFAEWMRRNALTTRRGLDPWGAEYYVEYGPGVITVGSMGRDGRRDTEDDIRRSLVY
jgi:hypothetical protein